jgi:hypothetical protein
MFIKSCFLAVAHNNKIIVNLISLFDNQFIIQLTKWLFQRRVWRDLDVKFQFTSNSRPIHVIVTPSFQYVPTHCRVLFTAFYTTLLVKCWHEYRISRRQMTSD